MPSNLLNSSAGVIALRVAVMDQIERRIRRWFKRNTVIAFDDWVAGGKTAFSLQTVLGNLNQEHDEEVLNLLDLLQQFEQQIIVQDYDIYVDSVNGDDVNGIGTAASPFQSIIRAQQLIPKTICSKINVFLSGTFDNISNMNLVIENNGQLAFQSTDDPNVVDPGPYLINAWTPRGTGSPANNINVLGAPFIANDLKGKFIRMLDGASSGAIFAIAQNGVSDIVIGIVGTAPAPGDSFDIVEPGTEINSPNYLIKIVLNQLPDYYQDAHFSVNLIIAGCKLNIGVQFTAPGFGALSLPFCKMNYIFLYGSRAWIPEYDWLDNTQSINPVYIRYNDNNTFAGDVTNYSIYPRIDRVCIKQLNTNSINMYVVRCCLESVYQNQPPDSGIILYRCYLHNDNTKPAIHTVNGSFRITLIEVYIYQCTDVISGKRCDISIESLSANVGTISGVVLHIGPNAQVSFIGALPSPAAGDVTWYTTGATVAQPGIGASINDTHGSFVYRIS